MEFSRLLRFWRDGKDEDRKNRSADRYDGHLVVKQYKHAKAYDDLRDAMADMMKVRNSRRKGRKR